MWYGRASQHLKLKYHHIWGFSLCMDAFPANFQSSAWFELTEFLSIILYRSLEVSEFLSTGWEGAKELLVFTLPMFIPYSMGSRPRSYPWIELPKHLYNRIRTSDILIRCGVYHPRWSQRLLKWYPPYQINHGLMGHHGLPLHINDSREPPEPPRVISSNCQDTQKVSVGISEARANPNVRQDVRVVTELDKKQQLGCFQLLIFWMVWFVYFNRCSQSFSGCFFSMFPPMFSPFSVGLMIPNGRCMFFSVGLDQPGSSSSGCRRCHPRIWGLAFWSLRKPRRVRMRSVGNCAMSSLKRGPSMEIRINTNVMRFSTTFARESARFWWLQMWHSEV